MTLENLAKNYSSAVEEMNKINPDLNSLVDNIMCKTVDKKIQIYKTELEELKPYITNNCYKVYDHIYRNMISAYYSMNKLQWTENTKN